MEFNSPAGTNLFDRARIVGKSTPRIDGPLKTAGQAPYAAERPAVPPDPPHPAPYTHLNLPTNYHAPS